MPRLNSPATNFSVTIDLNNAAFDGSNEPTELARILRETADKVERDGRLVVGYTLHDTNGNAVGHAAFGSK